MRRIFIILSLLIAVSITNQAYAQIVPEKIDKKVTESKTFDINSTGQSNSKVDFGPYMRSLQRKIKDNWCPPSDYNRKNIVVLFKLDRNGNLLKSTIKLSSGNSEADNTALNAISKSAPFRSVPTDYIGNYLYIQFTFDYNVFYNN